jgi:hypothetical protein
MMSRDTCLRCPATSQGAPGRSRTCDARFRKPTLYPLSYGGVLVKVLVRAYAPAGCRRSVVRQLDGTT